MHDRSSLDSGMLNVHAGSSHRAANLGEPAARIASPRKIRANRHNAEKSTGPKSARGKARSRLNACKLGVFATQRLIFGEDEGAYAQLSTRLISELAPNGTIEGMLVDQMIADLWRLQRVDSAERAYLGRVQELVVARELRLRRHDEFASPNQHTRDPGHRFASAAQWSKRHGHATSVQSANEDAAGAKILVDEIHSCALGERIDGASDLGISLLEGIADPSRTFAYNTLDHIRRALVRDILRKIDSLSALRASPNTMLPQFVTDR
jgi:hypothetical protein